MARYIDADKLKEKKYYSTTRHEYCVSVADIDWQLTADVQEVKHASYNGADNCSICGSARPTDHKYDYIIKREVRYCYYCGAKMDKE